MNRYPYTDMHEMNLDWILLKVKEMIAEWDNTKNAWNELKEFVETYFENLDVQQEINNKLDEMARGGELAELMQPYLETQLPIEVANQIADVVALQIGAVVAAQLPDVVSGQLPAIAADAAAAEVGDWLAAHVDPDTGYVIDNSLTVSLAAADAKAAGDRITVTENVGNAAYPELKSSAFSWTMGKRIGDGGTISNNAATALTDAVSVTGGSVIVNRSDAKGMNDADTIFFVSEYENSVWQRRTQIASDASYVLDDDTDAIRIVFGYAGASGNTETEEDVALHFACQIIEEAARKKDLDSTIAILAKAVTTDASQCTAVESGTDYDNLTTPGNYKCTTGATAQTLVHCPVTVSHRLIVLQRVSNSTIVQIILASETGSPIYIRNVNEGTWHQLMNDITSLHTMSDFVTGSTLPFNDLDGVTPNTVWTINGNAEIANMPNGNLNVGDAGDTHGRPTGTLINVKGCTRSGADELVQMFFGQSGGDFAQPVMNFRTKYYSSGEWHWSPWAQFAGLFGVLRATNTFIKESRIQAGTADFDDMDNAPNNTIYQVDLDAVSMAHNPMTGHSCVLITFAPSFISDHGRIQVCCGTHVGAQLYFRYGYQQSAEEYRWTTWKHVLTEEA